MSIHWFLKGLNTDVDGNQRQLGPFILIWAILLLCAIMVKDVCSGGTKDIQVSISPKIFTAYFLLSFNVL